MKGENNLISWDIGQVFPLISYLVMRILEMENSCEEWGEMTHEHPSEAEPILKASTQHILSPWNMEQNKSIKTLYGKILKSRV